MDASTGKVETHKKSQRTVEDLATRRSSRSGGDGIWCPVCGGLLGVACSGHHARIEVVGAG